MKATSLINKVNKFNINDQSETAILLNSGLPAGYGGVKVHELNPIHHAPDFAGEIKSILLKIYHRTTGKDEVTKIDENILSLLANNVIFITRRYGKRRSYRAIANKVIEMNGVAFRRLE